MFQVAISLGELLYLDDLRFTTRPLTKKFGDVICGLHSFAHFLSFLKSSLFLYPPPFWNPRCAFWCTVLQIWKLRPKHSKELVQSDRASVKARIPALMCLLLELEPVTTIHPTPASHLSQNLRSGAGLWDHWVQLIHFSSAKVLWSLSIYVPLHISQGSPEKQNKQDVYRNRDLFQGTGSYDCESLANPKIWWSRLTGWRLREELQFKFKGWVLAEFLVIQGGQSLFY